jgi:hypothetical protein
MSLTNGKTVTALELINSFLISKDPYISRRATEGIIYLIRLARYRYKVGFTINLDKRLEAFRCVCPFAKVISIKNGTLQDEIKIHTRLGPEFRKGNSEVYSWPNDRTALENFY